MKSVIADDARHRALATAAGTMLRHVRQTRPRVHCLTNTVAQNISANVLLAAGAVPSMTQDPEVIEDFVDSVDALVINLGMLDDARKASIPKAVLRASAVEKPWLLDPVKIDRSDKRFAFAADLIGKQPTVLRCNPDEWDRLAAANSGFSGVVAVTGACDLVQEGSQRIGVLNGDGMMDRVTAMGCACSALIGAFLAVENDSWSATVAGLVVFGIAGEIAAERSSGPGTFQVNLLDALYGLTEEMIEKAARFE